MTSGAAMFSLQGRMALVTGSSQGIGLALAAGLAAAGARVVLNGRRADVLAKAVGLLRDSCKNAEGLAFDVTNAADDESSVAHAAAAFGAIDILINNAGMQHRAPLTESPFVAWRQLIATNVDSMFLVGRAVARRMVPRGSGRIINIASVQSADGRTPHGHTERKVQA
jgi:gluconate 5-dehydrogenase